MDAAFGFMVESKEVPGKWAFAGPWFATAQERDASPLAQNPPQGVELHDMYPSRYGEQIEAWGLCCKDVLALLNDEVLQIRGITKEDILNLAE